MSLFNKGTRHSKTDKKSNKLVFVNLLTLVPVMHRGNFGESLSAIK